jgi:hypothetical protein
MPQLHSRVRQTERAKIAIETWTLAYGTCRASKVDALGIRSSLGLRPKLFTFSDLAEPAVELRERVIASCAVRQPAGNRTPRPRCTEVPSTA